MLPRRLRSSERMLASVLLPILAATNAAFSQASSRAPAQPSQVEQQPWQRKPFGLADELDENKFRQNLLKVMLAFAQSAYRKYQAESSLFPKYAPSDPNEPVGVYEALRGSTLLDLHEQGVVWLSLLLSSHDPALRTFQEEVISGLEKDPSLSSKQVKKQVRKYDVDKRVATQPATELIVQTENEFSTLVNDLDSTVPRKTDSKEYYERIVAAYKGYMERQLPRVLDVSKPGQATTFLFLSPRYGISTPLDKPGQYKQVQEEAKAQHVIPRDIRYQGMYVVRVTPLDSKGTRFHLTGFWLYLRINDPEMYVPRDPLHALNSAGAWDLHHMPPAELSDKGLVSPAAEWMEVEVRNGKLVIVKGRSSFLQRRATKIDLAVTPVDQLQPAEGDIEAAVPGIPLDNREQAALADEFQKGAASLPPGIRNPKMFVDQMPPLPGRFQYPDTPEGQRAFEQDLAKATSPLPGRPVTPATTGSSKSTSTQPELKVPPSPPLVVEALVKPSDIRFDFGKLPPAGEEWLKSPYSAPVDIQRERLQLALYWVSRFLEDAKNQQSQAVQLLLARLPGKIFCVNNQSVHLPHPVPGGVVLAGMKNSFDDSLPAIATDLLGAFESLVYQFNNGQPNSGSERAGIARLAREYFSSQPIDDRSPDPFLVAARTPQPTPEQWKLLTLPRAWDCPNPYHFLDQTSDDGDAIKRDDGTVDRLKQEKAIITELNLDGVFNKDKQGNYRNDQGALIPIGLLFQLILKEPVGLLLLGRSEENERVIATNDFRSGDSASAAHHLAKANEIAGMIETVRSLRKALPDAYLDLYLTKSAPEKRGAGKGDVRVSVATDGASDTAVWRSRWMEYKGRWTLIAGIQQSEIPLKQKSVEELAAALNEKLPSGSSVLPAIGLLKECIQHSSNPQYGTYAAMFDDIDRR